MLSSVCQRFCHNVIGGTLDGFGKSSLDIDAQLDRHRGAATTGPQGGPEAAVGQHGRMNALRDLPQFLACLSEAVTDIGYLIVQIAFSRQRGPKRPNSQSQGDEALLCSVVQVALDAPPGLVAGGDDARAGSDQLATCFGIRDGG